MNRLTKLKLCRSFFSYGLLWQGLSFFSNATFGRGVQVMIFALLPICRSASENELTIALYPTVGNFHHPPPLAWCFRK